VNVAYQVIGEGPDLVFVPGWISHIEHHWESPACASFLSRLAASCRLIMFDKRGTGLSDRSERLPGLEERMDDITSVMSAAGSERAALFGYSEGGAIASLFAATYPHATAALVLYAANAKCTQTADYPWGYTPEQADRMFTDYIEQSWGSGDGMALACPSVAGDPDIKRWAGELERLGASPGAALALWRTDTEMDVRPVLSTIQAPTLVIHRVDDQFVNVGHGRFLAEHIPGARYLELDGNDHVPWFGDAETLLVEIERFLAGSSPDVAIERTLATIMVTDIAAHDEAPQVLHETVHRLVARYDGRADRTAGGALRAAFDGPARAIRCAAAISEEVRRIGVEARFGLHTGECDVHGATLAGVAVNLAASIAIVATPGRILVTRTVRDLVVGSGIEFEDRGEHHLPGLSQPWQLLEVTRPATKV
jgi:pimeloyl-ACP methyl ester carboxylesterase